jgi:CHASE2 domain-containing sensor protein
MKTTLRKLFSPILNYFESGYGNYVYKPSHRKILLFMGCLSFFLSIISLIAAVAASQTAGFIPILVFFIGGFVCVIVGLLGNEHAVAKIWGSK